MKANQFANNEDAVSPVIGVILMVAITVVLAAVVFVLVSDLGSTEDGAPGITFSLTETDDRLFVQNFDSGATWDRVAIQVLDAGTGNVVCVSESVATTGAAGACVAPSVEADTVTAVGSGDVLVGDYLEFCSTHATAEAAINNLQVRVLDLEAKETIATITIGKLATCN